MDDVDQHTLGQHKRVGAVLQKETVHFMEHPIALCDGQCPQTMEREGCAIEWATHCQASWGDYHVHDDRRCVWKSDIGPMGKLYCVCRTEMSTETPGDIASANYFCLHTLWINCCVLQHIKSPFVAYEEARHRKVNGLHVACIMYASVH